jgi:hypothetical protein
MRRVTWILSCSTYPPQRCILWEKYSANILLVTSADAVCGQSAMLQLLLQLRSSAEVSSSSEVQTKISEGLRVCNRKGSGVEAGEAQEDEITAAMRHGRARKIKVNEGPARHSSMHRMYSSARSTRKRPRARVVRDREQRTAIGENTGEVVSLSSTCRSRLYIRTIALDSGTERTDNALWSHLNRALSSSHVEEAVCRSMQILGGTDGRVGKDISNPEQPVLLHNSCGVPSYTIAVSLMNQSRSHTSSTSSV